MLKHTSEYLSAVKQRSKRQKTALELKNPNNTFSLNQNITDKLTQVKITANGTFLATAMKKAEIYLSGTDFSNLQGKTFKITSEQENVALNKYVKISLGVFTVKEVKTDYEKLETILTAYDVMGKFAEEDFNETHINFPTTVKDLIKNIATNNGLTVDETNLNTLANINLTIDQNLWLKINNTTTRNVLDEIAKTTATNIVIRDEEIVFKKHTAENNSYVLNKDNLLKFKLGQSYGNINSVVIGREPQNDNIVHKHNSATTPENTFDIKIVNNEILDKRRVETIVPIYNVLVGNTPYLKTYEIECKTEGHGFYEVGDYIPFNLNNQTGNGFLSEIILIVKAGLDETLKFKNPSNSKTNHKTAGSIIKTIWNTEIETDKQKQQISAIVEKTETIDQKTRTELTKLEQNINNFNYRIQKAGSLNLIKNSAFWSWEKDKPSFWQAVKNPQVQSSAEAKANGSISARTIFLSNNTISQTISTVINEPYSFSCLIKKPVIGNLSIKIYQNGEATHTETIAHGKEEFYKKIQIQNIIAKSNEIKIEISSDNAQGAILTDMMFVNSNTSHNWTMAQGEIANSNVVIDEKGILVKSSLNEGDYTIISPLEFSGYSKIGTESEKVFSLNKDTTEVKKLKAEDELSMTPIKIVAIKEGETTGWAFVKNGER